MKKVIITAIGSFSASAAISACRDMGYEIIGTDIYPMEWVANSLDVDTFCQAPRADAPDYIEFMNKLEADYIVPLTDPEVDVLSAHRNELNARLLLADDKTIKLCRDKLQFSEFAGGIPTHSFAMQMPSASDYPIIIKPVHGRSSVGLRRIDRPSQLGDTDDIEELKKSEMVWEHYIDGPVITVDVCRHPKTGHTEVLARQELLRTPNGAGTSIKIMHDKALESYCKELADKLQLAGTVCFEFIKSDNKTAGTVTGTDCVYHILECNPRFSGGIAFSVLAGYDFVSAHFAAFTMDDIPYMDRIREQHFARRWVEMPM